MLAKLDQFSDLDELVVLCRADGAKSALLEAVICYRAGAYRSAIISTWRAVVFDYLSKIRELDLTGNGEATKILASFETARKSNDPSSSLKLERVILDDAEKIFELLSPLEKEDLERLQFDRHRCAHPSLVSIDEPYSPPPELVRTHLRNAVVHLLSRPPIQGKEAFENIWRDINSDYFPVLETDAIEKMKPRISRARISLITKLLYELVRGLLSNIDQNKGPRFLSALKAIIVLYHSICEDFFTKKLSKIADTVKDEELKYLLRLCAEINICWIYINSEQKQKIYKLVKDSDLIPVLLKACKIQDTLDIIVCKKFEINTLIDLAIASKEDKLIDKVISLFEKDNKYTTFKSIRTFIKDESVIEKIDLKYKKRMILAIDSNPQIVLYTGFQGLFSELFEAFTSNSRDLTNEWLSISNVYKHLTESQINKLKEMYPEEQIQ